MSSLPVPVNLVLSRGSEYKGTYSGVPLFGKEKGGTRGREVPKGGRERRKNRRERKRGPKPQRGRGGGTDTDPPKELQPFRGDPAPSLPHGSCKSPNPTSTLFRPHTGVSQFLAKEVETDRQRETERVRGRDFSFNPSTDPYHGTHGTLTVGNLVWSKRSPSLGPQVL